MFDIEYSLKKSDFLIRLKTLVDIKVFLAFHFIICSKSRLICMRTYPREGCFIKIQSLVRDANLRSGGNIAGH